MNENKYSKKIKVNLGYGIIMILIGLFAVYEYRFSIFGYLWILLGFIQTGIELYEMRNPYLTIENNKLTKHTLIPNTVEINEVKKLESSLIVIKLKHPKKH